MFDLPHPLGPTIPGYIVIKVDYSFVGKAFKPFNFKTF
jgi:hypothetical protein